MIDLEQDAIDLSLEHIKAQHTWLRWLRVNSKYLLGQYCMWTTFGNQIFFGQFLKSLWYSLSRTLWIFRWSIPRHNILEFGGRMCNICLDSLLCGQLLGNQISFCDCWTGHDSLWAGRDGSFIGTYQTTTYSNLVAECEISARAVFYVDNFGKWLSKISLGDFWIFHNTLEHKTVGLSLEYVKAPHHWRWCLGFAF